MAKSKPKAQEPQEPEPPAVAEEPPAEEPPAEETAPEEPVFANRAERRAHGKGKGAPPPAQKGHYPHGHGTVQGPRMWGNRRSG